MIKYIEAEKAIKILRGALSHEEDSSDAEIIIRNMPAADVQEVRHGHWTTGRVRGSLTDICSVCGCDSGTIYHYDYCPNCGSRMDLEEE